MQYDDFIDRKRVRSTVNGFAVDHEINLKLFDWQRDIVRWALRIGKSAIFAERGLGKTAMELTWADEVARYTGGKVLILTPLAVAHQRKPQNAPQVRRNRVETLLLADGAKAHGSRLDRTWRNDVVRPDGR